MENGTTEKNAIVDDIARLWNCTDRAERDAIAREMAVMRFKKDELIYREGNAPCHMLFLVSGKAKIIKECGVGRAQIVRAVKRQTFLGYRAFFANESYTTSAMAFEDSVVAALPFTIVTSLMAHNQHIAQYFIGELSAVLGFTDSRIVSLTQKHIRGRLAETILDLKKSYGIGPDGQTLNITMNRDDLASLSNMSTSNAIRTLSSFAHDRLLVVEGKRIKILDEERLTRVSDLG